MRSSDRTATIVLGLGTIALLAVAAASSGGGGGGGGGGGENDTPDPNPDKPDPYIGPEPYERGDDKPRPLPDRDPPDLIGPRGLWVSPNCNAWLIGPDWLEEVAIPAARGWAQEANLTGYQFVDNVGKAEVFSRMDYVIRTVLMAYIPDCLDSYRWTDLALGILSFDNDDELAAALQDIEMANEASDLAPLVAYVGEGIAIGLLGAQGPLPPPPPSPRNPYA